MMALSEVGMRTVLAALLLQPAIAQSNRDAMFSAVKGENLKAVQALIAKDPKLAKVTEQDGSTTLHALAYTQIIRTSVTNVAKSSSTALETTNKWTALAAVLLSNGVDINTRDKYGVTALHWAINTGKYPLAEFLIEKGADVNASIATKPGAEGATPLHFAAGHGQSPLVKLLLAKGANPTAKTKDGKTPLDIAKEYKWDELVPLLSATGKPQSAQPGTRK
jgi:uncharacterized protein